MLPKRGETVIPLETIPFKESSLKSENKLLISDIDIAFKNYIIKKSEADPLFSSRLEVAVNYLSEKKKFEDEINLDAQINPDVQFSYNDGGAGGYINQMFNSFDPEIQGLIKLIELIQNPSKKNRVKYFAEQLETIDNKYAILDQAVDLIDFEKEKSKRRSLATRIYDKKSNIKSKTEVDLLNQLIETNNSKAIIKQMNVVIESIDHYRTVSELSNISDDSVKLNMYVELLQCKKDDLYIVASAINQIKKDDNLDLRVQGLIKSAKYKKKNGKVQKTKLYGRRAAYNNYVNSCLDKYLSGSSVQNDEGDLKFRKKIEKKVKHTAYSLIKGVIDQVLQVSNYKTKVMTLIYINQNFSSGKIKKKANTALWKAYDNLLKTKDSKAKEDRLRLFTNVYDPHLSRKAHEQLINFNYKKLAN